MKKDLPAFGLSRKARRTVPQAINYLLQAAIDHDDLISLAAGMVDEQTLPAPLLRRLADRLLDDEQAGRKALQYGSTEGLLGLREALLEHVCRLEGMTAEQLSLSTANVVVSSGSQQILYILTETLVDPGDVVITEWPSYFVYTGGLRSLGAEVRAIDMDADGMRVDQLAEVLDGYRRSGELGRVKMVYTCDYCQNPTGITLSAPRRRELLEIVRSYSTDHRICIVEDAAYRELTVEGDPPPSIKSGDPDNAMVALLQSFSKSFSPGMRAGYAVLPDDLVAPVLDQKGNHDFGSSNFIQNLLAELMASGRYPSHVEMLRGLYRAKRDAMLAALEEHLGDFEPEETTWTRPRGGLYVWLALPEQIDTGKGGTLFAEALAAGVLYVPGEFCFGPDPRRRVPRNCMRLTFGTVSAEAIDEGVRRLAGAIRKVAAGGRKVTTR